MRNDKPTGSMTSDRNGGRFDYLSVAVMVLLVTVPYLHKAFHIDDNYYLQVAQHILIDPWRPYDFTWIGQGERISAFTNFAPPLFAYVLALGVWAFGEREIPLHGIMGLFVALAGASMYSLASRFSPRPLVATALVLFSPLFVPGQNLMVDTPMMALGLAGMALYIKGTDRSRLGLALLGGLLVGLAFVTKYPAMILFPLMVLYSVGKRSWLVLPALVVGLIPFALWCTQNLLVHGVLHFPGPLYATFGLTWNELFRRVLSLITILGSGFFPFLTAPRLLLAGGWRPNLLIASIALAGGWQIYNGQISGVQTLQHVLFLSGGLFLLFVTLVVCGGSVVRADPAARFDILFLGAWLLLSWFIATRAPFIAVRHVLWALAPAAFIVTRVLTDVRSSTNWTFALIAIVAALGLSVGWADMELANLYRQAVAELNRGIEQRREAVLYLGEDGFAHYCAASGIRAFVVNETVLKPDDLLVVSSATGWALPVNLRDRLKRVRSVQFVGRLPMSTMSYGVNFYRTGTVDLPWAVGNPPLVYHDVFVVKREMIESK